MRIGYSMWGFLGPGVIDTPDGSRSYRRPFIDVLIAAGHEMVFLQANRDLDEAGTDLRDRYVWHDGLPELDMLMLEWRWPLPGRNTTPCGTVGHTCDLHRQTELIQQYTDLAGIPTVIWDLDRQLAADDGLRRFRNVLVAEFALDPTPGAVTVRCPVPDAALDAADPTVLAGLPRATPLVYVGNQYDRDDAFAEYFASAARSFEHRVAGKWPRTRAWPQVRFTGRCPFDDVEAIYQGALATVVLLPDRYAAVGHMTSRLFEAVLAGCVPLLPANVAHADVFVPPALLVADGDEVVDRIKWLQAIAGTVEHAELLDECLRRLEPFRASRQAAILNRALQPLSRRCEKERERDVDAA